MPEIKVAAVLDYLKDVKSFIQGAFYQSKSRDLNKNRMEYLTIEVIKYDLFEEEQQYPKCSGKLHKTSKEIRKD